MSLLLQALQKASKTRDDVEGEQAADSAADDLSLEPIAEPTLKAEGPVSRGGPTAAQAATVLRAAEAPRYGPLDWAQEHYMLTFLGAAILFAIGYGTYVYLQISNPAFLRSKNLPVPGWMERKTDLTVPFVKT